jgi:hypothetical protein
MGARVLGEPTYLSPHRGHAGGDRRWLHSGPVLLVVCRLEYAGLGPPLIGDQVAIFVGKWKNGQQRAVDGEMRTKIAGQKRVFG